MLFFHGTLTAIQARKPLVHIEGLCFSWCVTMMMSKTPNCHAAVAMRIAGSVEVA